MVRPVSGSQPPERSGNNIPTSFSAATLNAINYLWFATYNLPQDGGNNAFNLRFAAQAIAYFAAQMSPPPTYESDTASYNLYQSVCVTKYGSPPQTLQQLAQNLIAGGAGAEVAFRNALSASGVADQVHSWWGAEGDPGGTGPTKVPTNPQSLSEVDFKNFIAVLNSYEAGGPGANTIEDVQAAMAKINAELAGIPPSSRDVYSQMLYDMLNTVPVDASGDTLSQLGAKGSLVPLATALSEFQLSNGSNELSTLLQGFFGSSAEWPS